jgi:hypothetical protein
VGLDVLGQVVTAHEALGALGALEALLACGGGEGFRVRRGLHNGSPGRACTIKDWSLMVRALPGEPSCRARTIKAQSLDPGSIPAHGPLLLVFPLPYLPV